MSENIYSKERKELQAQGLAPEWMTTGGWQMFKQKYLYKANNPREQYQRIASTLAKHINVYPDWWEKEYNKDYTWEQAFFDILWNNHLSPSTPVLGNTGTDRGCTVSCSGTYIGDNVYSFYENLQENAVLTQEGFGTSSYLGDIRPRGTLISRGGKASGILPVVKAFVQMSSDISQGSNRRGAWAGSVPIDHPDWDEVCDFVNEHPDDVNAAWLINDVFRDKLLAKDKEAMRRWGKALKVKMTTGKGYLTFIDKINRKRPEMYVDQGLFVKASQLCVAPETLILTDTGYQTISELENQKVNVWNGKEWSEVTVVKTGENQELVTVKTSAGIDLDCTPYHKFYVKDGKKVVEKRAWELELGDKLIKLETPVIEGDELLDFAYQNGFYSGDGCNVNGRSRIYLYGEKQNLFDYFPNKEQLAVQPEFGRTYFYMSGLKHKFFVPDAEFTVKSRIDWFAGLLDADGCLLTAKEGTQSLQIVSVEKGFLTQVQRMLHTLGVHSKVVAQADGGMRNLPANDGTGQLKEYYCKPAHRLLIGATGILQLLELGMKCNRLLIEHKVPNRECSAYTYITAVEYNGRVDDTYCFTEPKRHMGVFNGLLTGQCQEITLFSDERHSFTCVLSSVNAYTFRKWPPKLVFIATVFLDCVCGEFLQRARNIPGLEKAVRFTEKSRALGLGVMGLSSLFQEERIIFGSLESMYLNTEIFKKLKDESEEASVWMSQALGEPEWCKGYGVRNTHTTAVAPTKSTALIMGGMSEGINIDPAMTFTQTTTAGEVDRMSPVLLKLMKEKGVYNKKVVQDIVENLGSVQHVDWLDAHEKAVFRTAFETDQYSILRLASQRQRYLSQMQSLNLFFSGEESEEHIGEVMLQALLDENILSVYYAYSKRGVLASTGECEACQ